MTLQKRSKGPLRGFEDEKFSYVAFRRGTRPSIVTVASLFEETQFAVFPGICKRTLAT
ncbi:hypothetical protein OROMI_009477 [Orobanche minor]